jgi:transcriptional regulator GlxA family with amidase domain
MSPNPAAPGAPSALDRWNVAILVFDRVEVLDFAGPYEVFSRTRLVPGLESRLSDESAPFRVYCVARDAAPVRATGGLQITPDFTFASAPPAHLLVVPGGFGTRALLEDEPTLAWIEATAGAARRVASVCTGALLLARRGLLRGKRATTHWGALDALRSIDPSIDVADGPRFVDQGEIITSAGVAAGIEMSLHVVASLVGDAVARETARYIDFPYGVGAG